MAEKVITLKSGRVNEYLHIIDAESYGTKRMLSLFLGKFDDGTVLIDCGSSLDIKKSLRYSKINNIPLSSFKYLVTTHHHFDHVGGIWKLYEEIKKHNPQVKILTNKITKELLNDFELHLKRGTRTYGSLTGEMKPIEESAFQVIEPSTDFKIETSYHGNDISFNINNTEIKLVIFNTPGHTPDHQCPAFIKDGTLDFIHFGEAVGTIYHASKLVTMPTSMPIFYNNEKYMETLHNLEKLNPLRAGFGHFGLVNGKKNVRKLFIEHISYMKKFRKKIIKYYNQNPETSYVLEKMTPFLNPRTDLPIDDNPVLNGISLAIVYGEMISLGYREIPEEELVYYKKFYSL
ncbi:MAG: MBL fold metallo-hydrolase [Promethearchaeota archaeon]